MSFEVVCGVNWGDEGKGRIVDYLASGVDYVVRYQGGNNAGHTVVNDHGTFKLHLVPSGIFEPQVTNVLGPGMVIDLEGLVGELEELAERGIRGRVLVSDRATICFPFHKLLDAWEEARLGKEAYGSTKRGIAPAYGDRNLKKAVQVGTLLHPEALERELKGIVVWKSAIAQGVYDQQPISYEETLEWARHWGGRMRELVCDTSPVLERAHDAGKRILFEAQLGALRDLSFGIYPFTTSSFTLAGFAPVGGGLARAPERVVGVVKAFSTCIGAGPFVTEIHGEVSDNLREVAKEYGASTGRARRIGHFDAVASAYGVRCQGATELALTKLDCLANLDPLQLCTHYEVDGKRLEGFPVNALLERAQPVYEEMPGWSEDVSGVRRFEDLPEAARAYVLRIEQLVGAPIHYVSVGPEREAMILREDA